VSYGPETYVRTLVEQVKSVSRLEQVINEFDLYADMRRRGKTLEEIVAYMRDHIEIVRRGSDTFSITFTGEDPQKVQAVTNRLADLFIEENIKFRLLKSENNVKLLEDQAARLRAEVMEQERKIERFKAANLDRLPDQQQTTQIQLSAAQRQLDATSQSLVAARIRAANLREKLSSLKPIVITQRPGKASEDRKALERARKELQALLVQYSDRHPDVKLKKAEVEALEERVAAEEGSGTNDPPRRRVVYSSEYRRTEEELRLVEEDIERLEAEEERVKQRIEVLNERLEAMPLVALKLSELTNGLDVKREQADAYDKKATDARASLAMERNNQGSQFRSLDRARVPSKPVSPNRPVLIVIGGLVGLVLGVVMMVGLDILFRPFLDEQDLARFTGVQVLVSIPQVGPFPSEWERFRGQMSNLTRFLLGSLSFADEYHLPEVPPRRSSGSTGQEGGEVELPSPRRVRRACRRPYAVGEDTVRVPPPIPGGEGRGGGRSDTRARGGRFLDLTRRLSLRPTYADPEGPTPRLERVGNGRIEYAGETDGAGPVGQDAGSRGSRVSSRGLVQEVAGQDRRPRIRIVSSDTGGRSARTERAGLSPFWEEPGEEGGEKPESPVRLPDRPSRAGGGKS